MNDFTSESAQLRQEMIAATTRVFESGWYILGKELEAFEHEWAGDCGVKHCVGVGNGLDALEIGMRALGLGSGDEVITTPMTAFATVLSILRAGATPVFADITPGTAMLDPASVQRSISSKTKAILLVHLYGQVGEIDQLLAICQKNDFYLIEDCAQAHQAKFRGRPVGSFGDFGAWSFYPTKNLGAIGDGGAITTSSAELFNQAKALRNYGQTERYNHPILGMNSRLDELQAALLRVRRSYLANWTARRQAIAHQYHQNIQNPRVRLLSPPLQKENHVYHLFVITCDLRDELQSYLFKHGISTLIHYPIAAHLQKPACTFSCDPLGLSCSEQHAKTCLSIPCHPGLSDSDADQIIAAINSF